MVKLVTLNIWIVLGILILLLQYVLTLIQMGKMKFFISSILGITVWNTFLHGLGYYFQDSYETVSETVDMVANGIIGVLVLVYIYKVIRYKPPEDKI